MLLNHLLQYITAPVLVHNWCILCYINICITVYTIIPYVFTYCDGAVVHPCNQCFVKVHDACECRSLCVIWVGNLTACPPLYMSVQGFSCLKIGLRWWLWDCDYSRSGFTVNSMRCHITLSCIYNEKFCKVFKEASTMHWDVGSRKMKHEATASFFYAIKQILLLSI